MHNYIPILPINYVCLEGNWSGLGGNVVVCQLHHNSMANSHTDAPFTYDTWHVMSHDSPKV